MEKYRSSSLPTPIYRLGNLTRGSAEVAKRAARLADTVKGGAEKGSRQNGN